MRLVIGLATAGRRKVVSDLVRQLQQQTRLPDEVIVCPASPEDVDPSAGDGASFLFTVVSGDRGLPAQRNAILRAAGTSDVVLFLDDDFIPSADYVEHCVRLFEANPQMAMLTGYVVADGINSAGLDADQANAVLAADSQPEAETLETVYCGYGCNMAVRSAPVYANGLEFDETLPLYGWLEDVDFSRRLAKFGEILKSNRCRGVHMGVKNGRTSGVRLGYSQVANPIYMLRKGTMSRKHAASMMSRNLLSNLGRSFAPEPWVDRRGRLAGNIRALADFARGKLDPRTVLQL